MGIVGRRGYKGFSSRFENIDHKIIDQFNMLKIYQKISKTIRGC
jgi:hypothetical protein